eukprot:186356-Prymnesium_polylepis.1
MQELALLTASCSALSDVKDDLEDGRPSSSVDLSVIDAGEGELRDGPSDMPLWSVLRAVLRVRNRVLRLRNKVQVLCAVKMEATCLGKAFSFFCCWSTLTLPLRSTRSFSSSTERDLARPVSTSSEYWTNSGVGKARTKKRAHMQLARESGAKSTFIKAASSFWTSVTASMRDAEAGRLAASVVYEEACEARYQAQDHRKVGVDESAVVNCLRHFLEALHCAKRVACARTEQLTVSDSRNSFRSIPTIDLALSTALKPTYHRGIANERPTWNATCCDRGFESCPYISWRDASTTAESPRHLQKLPSICKQDIERESAALQVQVDTQVRAADRTAALTGVGRAPTSQLISNNVRTLELPTTAQGCKPAVNHRSTRLQVQRPWLDSHGKSYLCDAAVQYWARGFVNRPSDSR